MRNYLLVLLIFHVLTSAISFAIPLDDFNTSQSVVLTAPGTSRQTVSNPGTIGLERQIILTQLSSGSVSAIVAPLGVQKRFAYAAFPGTNARTVLTWTNFGPTSFTLGGHTAINLRVEQFRYVAGKPLDIEIRLTDGSVKYKTATLKLERDYTNENLKIPFSTFSNGPNGASDINAIRGLTILITGSAESLWLSCFETWASDLTSVCKDPTPTPSPTRTKTATPSQTPSITPTITLTPTLTVTRTPTPSRTPTQTPVSPYTPGTCLSGQLPGDYDLDCCVTSLDRNLPGFDLILWQRNLGRCVRPPPVCTNVDTDRSIDQDPSIQPEESRTANTFCVTPTPTITNTPTRTHTPSKTPTASRTPTASKTPTSSKTPTKTATASKTPTPSKTATPSKTSTASITPTWTNTASITPSKTPTATRTATSTPSSTSTITATATASPTKTSSPTQTVMSTQRIAISLGATQLEAGSIILPRVLAYTTNPEPVDVTFAESLTWSFNNNSFAKLNNDGSIKIEPLNQGETTRSLTIAASYGGRTASQNITIVLPDDYVDPAPDLDAPVKYSTTEENKSGTLFCSPMEQYNIKRTQLRQTNIGVFTPMRDWEVEPDETGTLFHYNNKLIRRPLCAIHQDNNQADNEAVWSMSFPRHINDMGTPDDVRDDTWFEPRPKILGISQSKNTLWIFSPYVKYLRRTTMQGYGGCGLIKVDIKDPASPEIAEESFIENNLTGNNKDCFGNDLGDFNPGFQVNSFYNPANNAMPNSNTILTDDAVYYWKFTPGYKPQMLSYEYTYTPGRLKIFKMQAGEVAAVEAANIEMNGWDLLTEGGINQKSWPYVLVYRVPDTLVNQNTKIGEWQYYMPSANYTTKQYRRDLEVALAKIDINAGSVNIIRTFIDNSYGVIPETRYFESALQNLSNPETIIYNEHTRDISNCDTVEHWETHLPQESEEEVYPKLYVPLSWDYSPAGSSAVTKPRVFSFSYSDKDNKLDYVIGVVPSYNISRKVIEEGSYPLVDRRDCYCCMDYPGCGDDPNRPLCSAACRTTCDNPKLADFHYKKFSPLLTVDYQYKNGSFVTREYNEYDFNHTYDQTSPMEIIYSQSFGGNSSHKHDDPDALYSIVRAPDGRYLGTTRNKTPAQLIGFDTGGSKKWSVDIFEETVDAYLHPVTNHYNLSDGIQFLKTKDGVPSIFLVGLKTKSDQMSFYYPSDLSGKLYYPGSIRPLNEPGQYDWITYMAGNTNYDFLVPFYTWSQDYGKYHINNPWLSGKTAKFWPPIETRETDPYLPTKEHINNLSTETSGCSREGTCTAP